MKLVYHIVYAFWYLLSLLPLRVLYFLSDIVYFPLYYVVRYRRRVVRENLTKSFPEKSEAEIIHIEKKILLLVWRLCSGNHQGTLYV